MSAQIGQRVVMLDGDLRNPRLHKIYRVVNEQGLSNLLAQPGPLTAGILSNSILQTDVPGLFILPSGPFADPASILHSDRLAEIVTLLRTAFDLVLIDTPPVLPFPDARIFGKLADAVVLGGTRRANYPRTGARSQGEVYWRRLAGVWHYSQ